MASSASGARPSPVCSMMPVALITGRRLARRLARISRERCARLSRIGGDSGARAECRPRFLECRPNRVQHGDPAAVAQGRREQLVLQHGPHRRQLAKRIVIHGVYALRGRAGTTNVSERPGSFLGRVPLNG